MSALEGVGCVLCLDTVWEGQAGQTVSALGDDTVWYGRADETVSAQEG